MILVFLKFLMKLAASVVCFNVSVELSESISRKKVSLGSFVISLTFGRGLSCSGRAVFLTLFALMSISASDRFAIVWF